MKNVSNYAPLYVFYKYMCEVCIKNKSDYLSGRVCHHHIHKEILQPQATKFSVPRMIVIALVIKIDTKAGKMSIATKQTNMFVSVHLEHNVESIWETCFGFTYKKGKNGDFPQCVFLYQHSTPELIAEQGSPK